MVRPNESRRRKSNLVQITTFWDYEDTLIIDFKERTDYVSLFDVQYSCTMSTKKNKIRLIILPH